MTTTTTGLILALDLGKCKTVACLCGRGGSAPRFETLATSRHELRAVLGLRRTAVVLFEACTLAGRVADLFDRLPPDALHFGGMAGEACADFIAACAALPQEA